jgi:DNA polymerase III subunit epsilon
MAAGISHRSLHDTPIAIIDFETTGLSAGYDRVVEVAVVRVEPGREPRVVLDTLVNPMRRMSASEIHGISDEDVVNAPRFSDIAGDVLETTNDCVVAAYNVYFDIKFLNAELFSAGVDHEPPHFCLMYLRPLLGLGPRCKLEVACQAHGIPYEAAHVASADALASGKLLTRYLIEAKNQAVNTFGELARRKSYKFVESFDHEPLPHPSRFGFASCSRLCSRSGHVRSAVVDPQRLALAAYWDTLKSAIADLEISDDELATVALEREQLGLLPEQIRSVHARVFASVINQFAGDQRLDEHEARRLTKLHRCLSKLGWAPGE